DAGAVHVIYGSAAGLTTENAEVLTQNSLGVDTSGPGDNFGAALTAGDFNSDGLDDLAVGAPGDYFGHGAVYVLYGSFNGLGADAVQVWNKDSSGIDGHGEETIDLFGSALAAGDFNGDGKDDLAIGVPFAALVYSFADVNPNAGTVHVLYGSAAFGLRAND